MSEMIKCPKHDRQFEMRKGCPDCLAEMWKPLIDDRFFVKVRYFSETTQELSPREYTYLSEDRLALGDLVLVPVRDTTTKALVTADGISDIERQAITYQLRTIPAGSKLPNSLEAAFEEPGAEVPISAVKASLTTDIPLTEAELTEAVAQEASGVIPIPGEDLVSTPMKLETALALLPGADLEVMSYFEEAQKLQQYAEARIIKTAEDNKVATDDLSIISKLKKAMEAKRKEYLEPLKAQVEAINETYKELMSPIFSADKTTRDKMLAYDAGQRANRAEQERINQLKIEMAQAEMKLTGEMSQSLNLVEVAPEPVKVIRTNLGSAGMTDHWVFEVFDFALLDDAYKIEDKVLLGDTARKYHDTKKVPGVRFYNEPYITSRMK